MLVRPVSRTQLIAGADVVGLWLRWSDFADAQANLDLPGRAASVTAVRRGDTWVTPVGIRATSTDHVGGSTLDWYIVGADGV